jgi:hypothetical protein
MRYHTGLTRSKYGVPIGNVSSVSSWVTEFLALYGIRPATIEQSGIITLWETNGTTLSPNTALTNTFHSNMQWAPDKSKFAASWSDQLEIRSATGQLLSAIPYSSVASVQTLAWAPESDKLLGVDLNHECVYLWDLECCLAKLTLDRMVYSAYWSHGWRHSARLMHAPIVYTGV